MQKTEQPILSPGVLEALTIGSLPDVQWDNQDDLCDCTFQRVGWWTNPYLGETLEIRLCCIWAELAKQYPDLVRAIPAFYDYNENRWVTGVREWDAETEMPKSIWFRHLARKQGRVLSEVREEYADKDHLRPRGKPKQPRTLYLRWGNDWMPLELAS